MIRTILDRQLQDLSEQILHMSVCVDEAFAQGLAALTWRELCFCEVAIASKTLIDSARQNIEQQAFRILTLQQPIGGRDLRFLTTIPAIAAELERIAEGGVDAFRQEADQLDQPPSWQWTSTVLSSLQTLFQFLRLYGALPQDHLRVFSSSSREGLEEQLAQENKRLTSHSATAAQFLQERNRAVQERAQSTAEQSISAQAAQQEATVTTWAKDVWEKHAAMRTAQAVQQGETVTSSSLLREDITTTGAPESNCLSFLDKKRLELELGPGGDHDIPYNFALPASMPQVLAWMRLLARVHRGELEP
jgi:hypothetical protein